jgi:hypothetical protein
VFFCDPCRIKNNWPEGWSKSRGQCEVCGQTASCYDVASSALPPRVQASDSGLKSIVADLYALRYETADIAAMVGRSERRVRQIIDELYPRPTRPHSVDDLPFHMKQRVLQFREQDTADLPMRQVTAPAI